MARGIDIAGSVMRGAQIGVALDELRKAGQARQARTSLQQLLAQGLPTNPAAQRQTVSQAGAIDPEFALQLGEFFQKGRSKPGEGQFTIGDVRYDAQGNPIVQGQPSSKMLTPGEFEQQLRLRREGRPSTTVNVGPTGVDYGDPPKDMAWARNPDGSVATQQDPETGFQKPVAVPVAGGPEEMERQKGAETRAAREAAKEQKAGVVIDDIGRIERLMEEALLPATGLGAGTVASIPGTAAADISSLLDTIKANVGFDQLQQMRNASETGGALGQVSEMENRLLQSVLGSLSQSQSEDQFRYNLQRLKDTFLDIVHGPGNRPADEDDTLPKGVTEEDIEFTMEKHGLTREEVLERIR